MAWSSSSKPERSAARKVTVTDKVDVFRGSKGGFLGTSKGHRTWADNKAASGSPKNRSGKK